MAETSGRAANPSLASIVDPIVQNSLSDANHVAGVTIGNGKIVYLDTDGTWKLATGAAANQAADAKGMVLIGNVAGEPVTVWFMVRVAYAPLVAAAEPAIGQKFFLSGTAPGELATTASTGGTAAIARYEGNGVIQLLPAMH